MHGVKKSDITPEMKEKIRNNIAKYKKLNTFVLSQKKQKIRTQEMLEKCTSVLTINSEHYTVWNYRREILLELFENTESLENKQKLMKNELSVIDRAMRRNPKSYCAFAHRQWCIGMDETAKLHCINLSAELGLCGKFLNQDERNFHCWDYRRFIVQKASISLKKELKYSQSLLDANFSNYSAWHYRSTLIPLLFENSPKKMKKQIEKELKLVKNAFYTEPDDQSAWLYYRWLLGIKSMDNNQNINQQISTQRLKQEYEAVLEILDLEPNAKWALLTSSLLIKALEIRNDPIQNAHVVCIENLKKLIQIDPNRTQYYSDVLDSLTKMEIKHT